MLWQTASLNNEHLECKGKYRYRCVCILTIIKLLSYDLIVFIRVTVRLIDLFPPPLAAKICCYGGQAIRLRLVKSIAFMVRWLENCSRKINLR